MSTPSIEDAMADVCRRFCIPGMHDDACLALQAHANEAQALRTAVEAVLADYADAHRVVQASSVGSDNSWWDRLNRALTATTPAEAPYCSPERRAEGWQCAAPCHDCPAPPLADAIRAHLAEHTDEAAGAVEQWTCPDCAFTFDAGHTDPDGGYSCPACAEHRALALADEWERDDEESLNTFGQHLMGGSVLSCAEYLRAALAGGASGATEEAGE